MFIAWTFFFRNSSGHFDIGKCYHYSGGLKSDRKQPPCLGLFSQRHLCALVGWEGSRMRSHPFLTFWKTLVEHTLLLWSCVRRTWLVPTKTGGQRLYSYLILAQCLGARQGRNSAILFLPQLPQNELTSLCGKRLWMVSYPGRGSSESDQGRGYFIQWQGQ